MPKIEVKVYVDGKQIPSIKRMKLFQTINTHHRFNVDIDIETAESQMAHTMEKSQLWIGKAVSILYGESQFLGVVASVEMLRESGGHGIITVSGYSNSFFMEGAGNMYSWTDKTLRKVVQEVIDRSGINATVNPEYQGNIEYESQYLETDFGFIQRLAKQYGEWLFYDGKQLIFGKPDASEAISLTYGTDLDKLNICAQTLAKPAKTYTYNPASTDSYTSKTPDAPTGLDELGQTAFNASIKMFAQPGNSFRHQRINSKSELDNSLKKQQEGEAANSHYIIAEGESSKLAIAAVVDVHSSILESKGTTIDKPIGSYIITEIEHSFEEGKYYRNHFKGIPSQVPTLPAPEVSFPKAHSQVAKVLRNDDTKKQGRVQVKMQWQTGNMQTAWLRVLSPSAGTSGAVPTNRGFVFIPEIDDEVLVDFEYGNPNLPYVEGSVFNRLTGKGGGTDNNIKSITTRSGHTLEFNDEVSGGWGITIKDDCGNVIHMSTKGKNIEITAPETIRLNAKNIEVNANENIKISAGEDIVESAGKNKTDSAGETHITNAKNKNTYVDEKFFTQVKKDATFNVLNNTTLQVTNNLEVAAGKATIDVKDQDMKIQATGKIALKSGDVIDIAQG